MTDEDLVFAAQLLHFQPRDAFPYTGDSVSAGQLTFEPGKLLTSFVARSRRRKRYRVIVKRLHGEARAWLRKCDIPQEIVKFGVPAICNTDNPDVVKIIVHVTPSIPFEITVPDTLDDWWAPAREAFIDWRRRRMAEQEEEGGS